MNGERTRRNTTMSYRLPHGIVFCPTPRHLVVWCPSCSRPGASMWHASPPCPDLPPLGVTTLRLLVVCVRPCPDLAPLGGIVCHVARTMPLTLMRCTHTVGMYNNIKHRLLYCNYCSLHHDPKPAGTYCTLHYTMHDTTHTDQCLAVGTAMCHL